MRNHNGVKSWAKSLPLARPAPFAPGTAKPAPDSEPILLSTAVLTAPLPLMFRYTRLAAAALATLACAHAHAITADLGLASQFSVVTFGDFTGVSGDTSSLLAAGGNVSLESWQVNAHGTPVFAGQSLIVGGNFTGNNGAVNGNSHIGGASTMIGASFNPGTVSTGVSPLDFSALKAQLSNTSTSVAAATRTGTVEHMGGSTQLTGTNSAVEVFDINGANLSLNTYLSSLSGSILPNATVILNISGTDVSMASFGFNLAGGSTDINLLLNFYEATSLTFANIAVDGSVLAPWANVTGASGHIEGTLVAKSFSSASYSDSNGQPALGHFEFHDLSFTPTPLPSPVPEPSQWALMAAGLLVLSARAFSSRSSHPATAVAGSGWRAVLATASPANRPAFRAGA